LPWPGSSGNTASYPFAARAGPSVATSCGHDEKPWYTTAAAFSVVLLVSSIGYIVVFAGGHDFCLSLSFVDGVQSGCAGRSEYNDNLPTSASGYTSALDAFDNDVAAYASGELVIAGLSGGGSSALWSMLKTRSDGVTPLYSRAVLFAPYIDVAVIGAYLDFAIHWLGLGELKLDFGRDCQLRRAAGKAGYCNYRLNRIAAMRQVARDALARLDALPAGLAVHTIMVENDGTVTNTDISRLATSLAARSPNTSICVAKHVDARHSPLSIWNYVHMNVPMPWVRELVCQSSAFLANGVPFPVEPNSASATEPDCGTSCGGGACSYDCVADAWFTCP